MTVGREEAKQEITKRAARLSRLHSLALASGALHLNAAADALGVSSMTVRRDLAAGSAVLSYLGGYVVPRTGLPYPERYAINAQASMNLPAKIAAAGRAAQLVQDGETIFVDCGTTTPHLVAALPDGMSLTIICYALNIAALAARRPNTRLVLLGGAYQASSDSFAVGKREAGAACRGITTAFLSAGGIEATRVSCSNLHEVPAKRAAIRAAAKRFAVVDASKLERSRTAPFATIGEFDAVVAAGRVTAAARRMVEVTGCRLIVAAEA